MKKPLLLFTIAFCLGIAAAEKTEIAFPVFFLASLLSLILAIFSLSKTLSFDIFLLSGAFCLGAAFFAGSVMLPKNHVSNFYYYGDKELCSVKGIVLSQPQAKENLTLFILNSREWACASFKQNCRGYMLVYVKDNLNLDYGDELLIKGNLRRPFRSRFLYSQGIYSVMRVSSKYAVIKTGKNFGFPLKKISLNLRKKMQAIFTQYVPGLTAGILEAMVLGEKANIPAQVTRSMMKTGTVHILVVSGFNVGIVYFLSMILLKSLRFPLRMRYCIIVPGLIIYCLLTGASTPVIRATIMALVYICGSMIKREPDIYNSLSIAALAILLACPRQLFDLGFQLSFVSVISIVCIYPKLKSLLRLEHLRVKALRFITEGLSVSFSAWLGTVGFIAWNFKIFSPVTVLANVFIVPLASLITLCGFSLVAFGLIAPPLAPAFASSNEFLVAVLLRLNLILVNLPAAYFYIP
jgi:competence protein ComEC